MTTSVVMLRINREINAKNIKEQAFKTAYLNREFLSKLYVKNSFFLSLEKSGYKKFITITKKTQCV